MLRSIKIGRVKIGLVGWGLWLGTIAPGQSIARAMPSPTSEPPVLPVLIDCQNLQPAPDRSKTLPPDVAENLGDWQLCTQHPETAIEWYQTALVGYRALGESAEASVTIALFKLARAHLMAEQPTAALDYYHQAIERDPIYGFLDLFLERQVSPLGEPVTDSGLRGNGYSGPTRAEPSIAASAQFELAYDSYRLGQITAALQAYRTALQLRPNFAQAHLGLGMVLERQMDYEGAIRAYQTALKLEPDLVWGHYRLGALLTIRYQPTAARAALRRVVDAHTGLDSLGEAVKAAIIEDLMGDFYQSRGDSAEADRAYQRALALAPQGPGFYLKLGKNCLIWGQHQRAIDSFRAALAQLPPDHPDRELAEVGIAEALVWSDRWAEARAQLDSVLQRWPNSADAQKLREHVNSRPR